MPRDVRFKMIGKDGGPRLVARRLLQLALSAPLLMAAPAVALAAAPFLPQQLWLLVPGFAAAHLLWCLHVARWWVLLSRRSVRERFMLCGHCGHSLRAIGGFAACPECGAARPSDTELRVAWWRNARLLRPFAYRPGTHMGTFRRRILRQRPAKRGR